MSCPVKDRREPAYAGLPSRGAPDRLHHRPFEPADRRVHRAAENPWNPSRGGRALEQQETEVMTIEATIYTAGYEGESVASFLGKLINAKIKLVLDVRSNAVSRKPGFSKESLRMACQARGIDYRHLPELGVPSKLRKNLNKTEDYEKALRAYERAILPKASESRLMAQELALRNRTALVCFEREPKHCHRERLARAISSESGMCVVNL